MPAKLTIEDMREIAASHGGKCLSDEYSNVRTKLLWQCAFGHTWYATPHGIKYLNTWCPKCANKSRHRSTIEDMRKIAKERGGQCLSPQYINSRTKLKWQCASGHVWETLPSAVKNNGRWCPKCAYVLRKKSIEDLQALAAEKGGMLLSEKYTGMRGKYLWQCADGHKWSATADSVKRVSWCPQCRNNLQERMCRVYFESIFNLPFPTQRPKWLLNESGNEMELDGYNEELRLAFEYNGKQHYQRVPFFQRSVTAFERLQRSDKRKSELCISHNTNLIVVPYTVPIEKLGDYIASKCRRLGFIVPEDWSSEIVDLSAAYAPQKLQSLRDIAESRGGQCLSKSYLGKVTKHEWECEHGHRWKAVPDSVINGTWCPECGGTLRKTLSEAQEIAKSRGGECLSEIYINNRKNLHWRCEKGHEWKATYSTVQQGSWCHECGGSKPKTLDDMHQLAAEQSGLCLSKEYINSHTKLKWQCALGHTWDASPANIYSMKWCPTCRDSTLSLEYIQNLAESNGGRCLSTKYKNNRTHLEFECSAGHRWMAQAKHIVDGRWCRACAGQKRRKTIEDMQELADRKGGKCLSTEYVKSNVHLEWECKNRHRWMAKPNNVQQGKWCRKCAIEERLLPQRQKALEGCKKHAQEKGGKCLSVEYVNHNGLLLWECEAGHQWKMPLGYIDRGSWCPECHKQDRSKRNK